MTTPDSDTLYFPGLVPTPFATMADFLGGNLHARRLLPLADEILGRPLLESGRDAGIYDWEVFETAHVIMGLALASTATQRYGLEPIACGGQSFGAITAAVYAGALDLEDGLRLIRASTRVEIDHFDSLAEPVGTLFFYRLTTEEVAGLVAESDQPLELAVHLDNLVHGVCGTLAALEVFADRVRARGGHIFYLMNRSEHCPSLQPLRDRLEREVYRPTAWSDPLLPLVSDVDGTWMTTGAQVRDDLLDGWVTPVRWSLVADSLAERGAERIFVIGPPSMFTRLVGRRARSVEVSPRSLSRELVGGGVR